MIVFLIESTLTWCHGSPVETPTSGCMIVIRAEEYFNSIASRQYHQVVEIRWLQWNVTTGPVHQGYPVPVPDLDKVTWAGVDIATVLNIKVGELQHQYLATLHFYCLRLLQVVWVVAREVWWRDNACDEES